MPNPKANYQCKYEGRMHDHSFKTINNLSTSYTVKYNKKIEDLDEIGKDNIEVSFIANPSQYILRYSSSINELKIEERLKKLQKIIEKLKNIFSEKVTDKYNDENKFEDYELIDPFEDELSYNFARQYFILEIKPKKIIEDIKIFIEENFDEKIQFIHSGKLEGSRRLEIQQNSYCQRKQNTYCKDRFYIFLSSDFSSEEDVIKFEEEIINRLLDSDFAQEDLMPITYIRGSWDRDYNIAQFEIKLQDKSLLDLAEMIDILLTPDEIINVTPSFIDEKYESERFFLPDECTIKFKPGYSKVDAEALIHRKGSKIIVDQTTEGYYSISVPENKTLFGYVNHLNTLPEVEFSEPSEFGKGNSASVPRNNSVKIQEQSENFKHLSPPYSKLQKFFFNAAANELVEAHDLIKCWWLSQVKARDAWTFSQGNDNTVVFILDEDIKIKQHPALSFRYENVHYDFTEGNDSKDHDDLGHGLSVAGLIFGIDPKHDFIGIAPLCHLISLRINLRNGIIANRIDALNFAVKYAERNSNYNFVINCSWHNPGYSQGFHQAIRSAEKLDNLIIVAAAGNYRSTQRPLYPAAEKSVISVGASTLIDTLANRSNLTSDILAPGEDIAVPVYQTGENQGSPYGAEQGTSFATPLVSGVIALMWSKYPHETGKVLKNHLLDSNNSDKIENAAGGKPYLRLNAYLQMSAIVKSNDKKLFYLSIILKIIRNFAFFAFPYRYLPILRIYKPELVGEIEKWVRDFNSKIRSDEIAPQQTYMKTIQRFSSIWETMRKPD